MNTQMHSLREQPEILKNYRKFHAANDRKFHAANDEREGLGLIEIIGIGALAFCVGFTILALAIPGG